MAVVWAVLRRLAGDIVVVIRDRDEEEGGSGDVWFNKRRDGILTRLEVRTDIFGEDPFVWSWPPSSFHPRLRCFPLAFL